MLEGKSLNNTQRLGDQTFGNGLRMPNVPRTLQAAANRRSRPSAVGCEALKRAFYLRDLSVSDKV